MSKEGYPYEDAEPNLCGEYYIAVKKEGVMVRLVFETEKGYFYVDMTKECLREFIIDTVELSKEAFPVDFEDFKFLPRKGETDGNG